jgi:sodium--glutamate symport carrier gltS
MYQTIAVAVIVLMAGAFLKKRISFLQKFCIPAPVIGGLLFAILTLVLYMTGVAVIDFDDTLKEVCMVFFFTSVGFQANLKVLKSGGKSLIVFLFLVIMLIVMQNFSAIGLANSIGLDSLTGMTTGSIPMVGGHGTAGALRTSAFRVRQLFVLPLQHSVLSQAHSWADLSETDLLKSTTLLPQSKQRTTAFLLKKKKSMNDIFQCMLRLYFS